MFANRQTSVRFLNDGWAQNEGSTPIQHDQAVAPDAAVATTGAAAPTVFEQISIPVTAAIATTAAAPPTITVPIVAGRGPAGAATFVLDIEQGAQVTYEWGADVIMSQRHPAEKRIELAAVPRETYAFPAYLTDAELATIQSALLVNAATGAYFLLGLMHEAATIAADVAASVVVPVADTAVLDWAYATSRVVVFDPATRSIQPAVVQLKTATTIVLDVAVTARAGMQIMPAMACLLDETQQVALYPAGGDRWEIRARSVLYGDAAGAWTVGGATVTTHDGYPVWDRAQEANAEVARALRTGSEVVDRGGVLAVYGGASGPFASSYARQVRYTIRTDADRQWLKKFLGTVVGRKGTFLLPTGRNDFFDGTLLGGGSFLQFTFSPEGTDYVYQLGPTGLYDWVRIVTTDGAVHYRTIVDAVDNFDTTQTIELDSPVAGTAQLCSLMEPCRWAGDAFTIEFARGVGRTDNQAIVVEP